MKFFGWMLGALLPKAIGPSGFQGGSYRVPQPEEKRRGLLEPSVGERPAFYGPLTLAYRPLRFLISFVDRVLPQHVEVSGQNIGAELWELPQWEGASPP